MDVIKLQHAEKEEEAIQALNKHFSDLFGEKFEIGSNALPSNGPETTIEAIHALAQAGRDKVFVITDEDLK